jgi:hypothetical protein
MKNLVHLDRDTSQITILNSKISTISAKEPLSMELEVDLMIEVKTRGIAPIMMLEATLICISRCLKEQVLIQAQDRTPVQISFQIRNFSKAK